MDWAAGKTLKFYSVLRELQKDAPFSTGVAETGLGREPTGRAVKCEAQISRHQVDPESVTLILDPAL